MVHTRSSECNVRALRPNSRSVFHIAYSTPARLLPGTWVLGSWHGTTRSGYDSPPLEVASGPYALRRRERKRPLTAFNMLLSWPT